MSANEKDDDLFNFSDQIIGESAKEPPEIIHAPKILTQETEIQTSYLLVNALMTLLVRKELIQPSEVQSLVAELHVEYMKKKGRSS
jgi:hypothetical protein